MDDRAPVPKLSWIDRLRERPRYLAACIAGGLVFVIGLVVALMSLTRAPSTAGAIESPSLLPSGPPSVQASASPSMAPSLDMHDMHERTPQPSQSIVTITYRLTVLGPASEGDSFALEHGMPEGTAASAEYLCAPFEGYQTCHSGGVYSVSETFNAGTTMYYRFSREAAQGGPAEELEADGLAAPSVDTTFDVVYEYAQASLGIRRVIVNDLRAREAPTTSATVVGTLQEGEILTLREGPVAADGLTWWRIEVGSLDGWVAEGTAAGPFLAEPGTPEFDDFNVWAATMTHSIQPAWQDLPVRAYVPNEAGDSVSVVDASTFEVIETLPVGDTPLHVTPAYDGSLMYVDNMRSHTIQELDPETGELGAAIPIAGPYNLYFSLDGTKAIVMVEEQDRIDFYDRATWRRLAAIDIPSEGVDHADLSAGGRYLLASTEFGGDVIKVDIATMEIVDILHVGGRPVDVKLAPDGTVFFVANQDRQGVSVVDPIEMTEVAFIPTAEGAHGLAISRDTTQLYVTNRDAGSISVIDLASRSVVATWAVGSTPDMLQVSADGSQLWVSFRYDVYVGVIDTQSGRMLRRIKVGGAPHGLALFPQPGRFSIGHNGVYR